MKTKTYDALFVPCEIGFRTAPNRLAAQPMESGDGIDGGGVSELTLKRYSKLARGHWGIVFVEAVSITESSLAHRNGLVINSKNLDGYKNLIGAFKKIHPDGLLVIQLQHSGIRSGPFSRVTSVRPTDRNGIDYLSAAEIERIRQDFIDKTLMVEAAGADGVDFKLCHGYLTTELLRPANVRNDRWGGSFDNRIRFFKQSVQEIRDRLKRHDFLLGSRVSMFEGIRGGCGTSGPEDIVEDLTEPKQIIQLMQQLGMDFVNVSAGLPGATTEIFAPTKSSKSLFLNHFRYAKIVKEMKTSLQVIGSAYSVLNRAGADYAADNIQKGFVDFAGFGRQAFADPEYPKKLQAGEKINFCTTCGGCGQLYDLETHVGCVRYNAYYKNLRRKLKSV